MGSRRYGGAIPSLTLALGLALLLALTLLVVSPADQRATAAPVALGAGPGDPGSTPPARKGPRTTRYRVIDHNVQRRPSAVVAAVDRAVRVGAQAITLQEACAWHADYLREHHPRWSVAFAGDDRHGACRDPRSGPLRAQPAMSGNLAIVTGTARATRSRFTFARQLGARTQNIVCLAHRAGFVRRICSTHLMASDSKLRKRIKANQARQVRNHTAPWVRRGQLVVLGGDFNANPTQRPLDFIYRFRGKGHFREATPRPGGDRRECRCRQRTFDGGRTKIDYVFFSANRMSEEARRRMTVVPTRSDHHLLDGWAMVSTRR